MSIYSTYVPQCSKSYEIFLETDCYWPINILDSGTTCQTTPEISDLILGSLAVTDKYIKVAVGDFVTDKQTG